MLCFYLQLILSMSLLLFTRKYAEIIFSIKYDIKLCDNSANMACKYDVFFWVMEQRRAQGPCELLTQRGAGLWFSHAAPSTDIGHCSTLNTPHS